MALSELKNRLDREVPIDSIAAYRILFGALMAYGAIRFLANGWIEPLYEKPSHFLKFYGFHWVPVFSAEVMTSIYLLQAFFAILMAVGLFYRMSTLAFLVLFIYVELTDVTNYLNHYILVIILTSIQLFIPMHGKWSLDRCWRKKIALDKIPSWAIWTFRLQLITVYFHAGIAKINSDWLLHGQPLNLWLSAKSELPLIGVWFTEPWVAYVMSWSGMIFDTTIGFLMLFRRMRPFGYLAIVVFHIFTQVLFNIGLFPMIMIISGTLFFDPNWPQKWRCVINKILPSRATPTKATSTPQGHVETRTHALSKGKLVLLSIYFVFQWIWPNRCYFYGGNVSWHEQGMRLSWRVMLREKTCSLHYEVHSPTLGRSWEVNPSSYLTMRQAHEISTQPDLVLQLAHTIGADYREKGLHQIEVRAIAKASLNGRAPQLIIDPNANLMEIEDSFAPANWILPAPTSPPALIHLSNQ